LYYSVISTKKSTGIRSEKVLMANRAVVLLSGGMDSATAAAVARSEGFLVHALTVDYGQRHRRELEAARRVAAALGTAEHRTIAVDLVGHGRSDAPHDPADSGIVRRQRRPVGSRAGTRQRDVDFWRVHR
jgi:NH3-dependent NAD+ synthetase